MSERGDDDSSLGAYSDDESVSLSASDRGQLFNVLSAVSGDIDELSDAGSLETVDSIEVMRRRMGYNSESESSLEDDLSVSESESESEYSVELNDINNILSNALPAPVPLVRSEPVVPQGIIVENRDYREDRPQREVRFSERVVGLGNRTLPSGNLPPSNNGDDERNSNISRGR